MLIYEYMIKREELVTLGLEDTLKRAIEILDSKKFKSLPVVHKDNFIGTLNEKKIYMKYFKENYIDKLKYLSETKVKEIILTGQNCYKDNEPIENVFNSICNTETSFFPVLDKYEKFVGIITLKKVLERIYEDYNILNESKITLILKNKPDDMVNLMKLLHNEGVEIINFTVKKSKLINVYKLVLKVENCDKDILVSKIESEGFILDNIYK